MANDTDVLIVGAGPAGLFAAYELARVAQNQLRITVIDKGRDVDERVFPRDITQGIGGTGLFSDGKLILYPYIGGYLREIVGVRKTVELIKYVDEIFVENGVDSRVIMPQRAKSTNEFLKITSALGIEWIRYPVRHIGTDNNITLIKNIKLRLEEIGVKILANMRAKEIITKKERVNSVKVKFATKETVINCEYVILAVGKSGAIWLSRQASKLGLSVKYAPIDIGVRVEVLTKTLEPLVSLCKDIKLRFKVKPYKDVVRTFCVCRGGYVVVEKQTGLLLVNGHSFKSAMTKNTNFGFLATISVKGDTLRIAHELARLVNIAGNGKPIVQRLDNFLERRGSLWRDIKNSKVRPSLSSITPGDITSVYPYRVVVDLSEGLEKLINLFPDLQKKSTLLYVPELTSYPKRIETNKSLETKIDGLYVIGDGSGVSHGIVQAAASGILAARAIIHKEHI